MKLLVFVTEDAVADAAVDALVEQGFRVTRLASSGGFLRRGNTTLLVGVEDTSVVKAQQTVAT
ncbi:MAG: cyclic-di-AMP receptor, partial [Roseiflexaceae bacterium]